MPGNQYHFTSNWRVQASIDEAYDVISGTSNYTRWWPAAYLDVLEIQSGDERGVGKVVRLATKGWLPYILHWHFNVTEAERPNRIALKAWGDFDGAGVWTFTQNGRWAELSFDWRISVRKPPLRLLSPLLRPLISSNHRWAMAKGEESLRLEIDRRHTRDEDVHLLPLPPPTTKVPAKSLWIGLGVLTAVLVARRLRR